MGRPGILRAAKFNRRGHRTSASESRKAIRDYLTSPFPNKGVLDAKLDKFKAQLQNATRTDEQHLNDEANVGNLSRFIKEWDENAFGSKTVLPIKAAQSPMVVGGVEIRLELDCLVHSTSKTGVDRVGAIFLNTQKGEGLGSQAEAIARRERAGVTVALLVLKRVMDEHAQKRTPFPADCLHHYVRQAKVWSAPSSFANELKDIEACGVTAAKEWVGISPPAGFDPARAKYHD